MVFLWFDGQILPISLIKKLVVSLHLQHRQCRHTVTAYPASISRPLGAGRWINMTWIFIRLKMIIETKRFNRFN